MDVSRKVLDAVALYIQYREAQTAANMLEDQLAVRTPYMTANERQTYEHIVGMYEIAHAASVPQMPPPIRPADTLVMNPTED